MGFFLSALHRDSAHLWVPELGIALGGFSFLILVTGWPLLCFLDVGQLPSPVCFSLVHIPFLVSVGFL